MSGPAMVTNVNIKVTSENLREIWNVLRGEYYSPANVALIQKLLDDGLVAQLAAMLSDSKRAFEATRTFYFLSTGSVEQMDAFTPLLSTFAAFLTAEDTSLQKESSFLLRHVGIRAVGHDQALVDRVLNLVLPTLEKSPSSLSVVTAITRAAKTPLPMKSSTSVRIPLAELDGNFPARSQTRVSRSLKRRAAL